MRIKVPQPTVRQRRWLKLRKELLGMRRAFARRDDVSYEADVAKVDELLAALPLGKGGRDVQDK